MLDNLRETCEGNFKIISQIVKQGNVTLTPIAGAASNISYTLLIKFMAIPVGSVIITASSSVLLTPALWATQFLASGVPILSIVDGFLNSLRTILRFTNPRSSRAKSTNMLDFLFGLPLIIGGFHALNAATWPASIMIAAYGYAIKTGYDFLKEIAVLILESSRSEVQEKVGYEKLVVKGLKFAGYICLSLGVTCFTAGFVCLAIAALIQNKTVRNIAHSTFSFFGPCCTHNSENKRNNSSPRSASYSYDNYYNMK